MELEILPELRREDGMAQPISATPQTRLSASPIASIKLRVAARLIDIVVHYIAISVGAVAAGFTIGLLAVAMGKPLELLIAKLESVSLVSYVMQILGNFAYYTICEGLCGATLGKRLLDISVLDEMGNL